MTRCFHCGEDSHFSRDCPQQTAVKVMLTCGRCGQHGDRGKPGSAGYIAQHVKRDCPTWSASDPCRLHRHDELAQIRIDTRGWHKAQAARRGDWQEFNRLAALPPACLSDPINGNSLETR